MRNVIVSRDWEDVQNLFHNREPHPFVVIDDFLKPRVLKDIREMLTNDGGWAPKNWQVNQLFNREPPFPYFDRLIEELSKEIPSILDGSQLVKHWAVACHENEGLHVHSDNASIAVNFWITDDSYNLAPDSGGLNLYKLKRSEKMRVHEFNAMPWAGKYFEKMQPDLLVKVPYKMNRAVIFDAAIFHATDTVSFKADSLESVRVGVTMAFDKPQIYKERMEIYREKTGSG